MKASLSVNKITELLANGMFTVVSPFTIETDRQRFKPIDYKQGIHVLPYR